MESQAGVANLLVKARSRDRVELLSRRTVRQTLSCGTYRLKWGEPYGHQFAALPGDDPSTSTLQVLPYVPNGTLPCCPE